MRLVGVARKLEINFLSECPPALRRSSLWWIEVRVCLLFLMKCEWRGSTERRPLYEAPCNYNKVAGVFGEAILHILAVTSGYWSSCRLCGALQPV